MAPPAPLPLTVTDRLMPEPRVHDSPASSEAGTQDRRQSPRSVVPPPARRTAALFPPKPTSPGEAPSRLRRLAREAVTERRNLIPLGIIIILSLMGISLLVRAMTREARQPPDPSLVHVAISSSQAGTSLFGNDRYLGEIGPGPREFTVPPGRLHLRLVRSHCRASDTTVEFKAGEQRMVGPLDPRCDRP
jgi:hypothetical protein